MIQNALQAWLDTRPERVRRLAAEFPLRTLVNMRGVLFFVIGYTEDDSLIVSQTDPSDNYDAAMADRQYVCAEHLR